jgi:hypothetical protein
MRYRVRDADTLPSIAAEHRIADWRTIWEHPDNAALREQRKSPHVLHAGDVVHVPESPPKQVTAQTGQFVRFVLEVPTVKLKLQLKDRRGQCVASKSFELEVDGRTIPGSTDADGKLEVEIPARAREASLVLELDGERRLTVPLAIGRLDPAEQPSGVRQRLRNLGLLPQEDPSDAEVEHALASFQALVALTPSGTPDAATQDELKKEHKS